MLILNLDWINSQEDFIKSKLSIVGASCKPRNITKILKSIYGSQKKATGWSEFDDITLRDELYPIIRILEENDLIIQRRWSQFKLKNGLTERVMKNYI